MKLIIVILLSLIIFVATETVKIECSEIKSENWWIVGEVKDCYVKNAKITEENSIVDNLPINTEVTAIYFHPSCEIHSLPKDLIKKFSNLKASYLDKQPIET